MQNSSLIDSKIVGLAEIGILVAENKKKGKTVGFTNGCFDILHFGHINYLSKAADLCDLLIIGVNSDMSVKKLKGPNRPINDQHSRTHVLAALAFVSYVIVFDQDTPYDLIKQIEPNVLIKGGDYAVEEIIGYDIVQANGGKTVTIDFVPGYSTSHIEQKIKDNDGKI
jgi:rfaE bifunctional protein nucleotidyltransferase chain/domain